ncbi:carbonic anhydrase 2-like isoform X1 [Varroa destructor]|uniref:Carbonic anhydrase n=2 Tax=Varroa destructor TaxID=109461 RepID=A0A7M7KCG8_VARDE|nr:carbonic anhydrase 2-like isoform X1 [Varroa destructor]
MSQNTYVGSRRAQDIVDFRLLQQFCDEMTPLGIVICVLLMSVEDMAYREIGGYTYGRDWGYESEIAPQSWRRKFKNCAGKRQSPINIEVSKVVVNSSLGRILLHGFKDKRVYTVKNIGSTVLVLPASADPPIKLVSENGEERYHFHSLHFHWTSEHAINSQYYSLEAHFVLYNEKYNNMANAIKYQDGLEVVSTMFALSPYSMNPRLRVLMDAVAHVLEPDFSVNVTMALEDILPAYISAYFRYPGSLTVPTCDEVVTWTMFYPPNYIGLYQLKLFRFLHRLAINSKLDSWRKLNNRRPLQSLNGRAVQMYATSYAPLYAG